MRYLLWQLAAESTERTPDAVAVSDLGEVLAYGALDRAAASLAGWLAMHGTGRGERVGLLAPKAARNVAAMHGVLRAGAAYVPVDPAAPAVRAGLILGNAGVRTLITTSRLATALWDVNPAALQTVRAVLLVDDPPAPPELPGTPEVCTWREMLTLAPVEAVKQAVETDPAYILYTSGSTGTPKGVVISHRNALTFVEWGIATVGVGPSDRLSGHAPFHFDLSTFDLYAALGAGASVHLVPDRVAPFAVELARWIHTQRITVWYSVPSALIRLLRQGQLERFDYTALRTVLFAGEVFPVKYLRDVMERFPSAAFYNWYGPTETNVCTSYRVPRPLPSGNTDLPIGRACANIEAFALTHDGRVARPGEEGELLVRGPCVMLGYWALPERTAESLDQHPLHRDYADPVYRTGDMVRVRDDEGGFTFLGRRDHMVKTRGYRVELGEIEHVLHECPAVRAAAVVALPDPVIGARIVGAYVPEPDVTTSPSDVLAFCGTRLPRYAVPEHLTQLDELPATSTGKVDRPTLGRLLTTAVNLQESQS
jgi:amino acid adenylation domain-containing protein